MPAYSSSSGVFSELVTEGELSSPFTHIGLPGESAAITSQLDDAWLDEEEFLDWYEPQFSLILPGQDGIETPLDLAWIDEEWYDDLWQPKADFEAVPVPTDIEPVGWLDQAWIEEEEFYYDWIDVPVSHVGLRDERIDQQLDDAWLDEPEFLVNWIDTDTASQLLQQISEQHGWLDLAWIEEDEFLTDWTEGPFTHVGLLDEYIEPSLSPAVVEDDDYFVFGGESPLQLQDFISTVIDTPGLPTERIDQQLDDPWIDEEIYADWLDFPISQIGLPDEVTPMMLDDPWIEDVDFWLADPAGLLYDRETDLQLGGAVGGVGETVMLTHAGRGG